jgi:hypothetical protein
VFKPRCQCNIINTNYICLENHYLKVSCNKAKPIVIQKPSETNLTTLDDSDDEFSE